jgi:hypothetical protein
VIGSAQSRWGATPRLRAKVMARRCRSHLLLLFLAALLASSGKFPGKCPLHHCTTQSVRLDGLKDVPSRVGHSSAQTLAQLQRESRATQRHARFAPQPGRALDGSLSLLETEAVSPLVAKDYATRVRNMVEWIHPAGGSFQGDHERVIWLLEYAGWLFSKVGLRTRGANWWQRYATFPCFQIHGTVSLSRLERAIQGWSRHSVSHARPPLPWHAATAIVGYLLHRQGTLAAVALLLPFLGLIRPVSFSHCEASTWSNRCRTRACRTGA